MFVTSNTFVCAFQTWMFICSWLCARLFSFFLTFFGVSVCVCVRNFCDSASCIILVDGILVFYNTQNRIFFFNYLNILCAYIDFYLPLVALNGIWRERRKNKENITTTTCKTFFRILKRLSIVFNIICKESEKIHWLYWHLQEDLLTFVW